MSFDIFESPLYRKAMEYNADTEGYAQMIDEINQAEGEYSEQIEPVNVRIQSLENMRGRIEEDGVDRGLITTVKDIVGDDDLLESHGVSLESFTSFPSRVNVHVALEALDEEHKKLLIAGLIGAGILIIGKIITAIVKFFKGRKQTAESTKELQEKVVERMEKVKEAEEELQKAIAKDEELKDVYSDALDSLEEANVRVEEGIDDACTRLIQEVVKNNETKDLIAKVFDQFEPYVKSIIACKDGATELNASMRTWVQDGVFEEKIKKLHGDILGKTPPQHMRNNIRDLNEKLSTLIGYAKETIEPDENFRKSIVGFVKSKRDLGFINNIEKWAKVENVQHLHETSMLKITDISTDLTKRLQEIDREYEGKVSKEAAKLMKEYIDYFRDITNIYLRMVTLFQEIVNGWNRMLRAVDNKSKFYKKIFKKVSKTIGITPSEHDKYKDLLKYFEDD